MPFVRELKNAQVRVSLFIDPVLEQVEAAHHLGAPVIELHTGSYCEATGDQRVIELDKIRRAAEYGSALGLEVHAGHGLNFDTVGAIAEIPEFMELNIGHFLVGEAIFIGFEAAIKHMRHLMDQARHLQTKRQA